MDIRFVDQSTSPSDILRIKGILKNWGSLALDIETSGNINDVFSMDITMLQLGNHLIQIVIDAREIDIVPFLNIIKDKIIVGHNLKFDTKVIYLQTGIQLSRIFDTMLAANVLECGDPKGKYTLESVAKRYVDEHAYTQQMSLFLPHATKKVRDSFHKKTGEFSPEQITYGALDVYYAYRLYIILTERLYEEDLMKTAMFEFEFLHVVNEIELNGFYLNRAKWLALAVESNNNVDTLLLALVQQHDINWNSPKQVVDVFKKYGIKTTILDKETLQMKDSVNVNVLKGQTDVHPLLSLYIEYKEAKKKASAYGEKFLRYVNPTTGRVHTSIWQVLETGRTSSLDPNLQQIPRDPRYRECFEAAPGNVLVKADFANQELRILADRANERAMVDAFINMRDIHLETARLAFENPNLQKDSEERQIAKNMNFLMAYGGGYKKLADNYGISRVHAKELIEKYYKQFSGLKRYFERTGESAKNLGYILIDEVIGRKSYIKDFEAYKASEEYLAHCEAVGAIPNPNVVKLNGSLGSKIQRDSQNRPIQGTGANMSKLAGILLLRYLRKNPGKFKIILMVHDEWILECKQTDALEVQKILEDTMLEASTYYCTHLTVPADGSINFYWKK